MSGFNNLNKFHESLRAEQQSLDETTRHAAASIAVYARDMVIKRIPPGNTTYRGMTNQFPGYAATGALKNSFTAGAPHKQGNAWVAHMGLSDSASRLNRIKAYVHEYGKVIRPKQAKVLVFQINGETIFASKVRIRAKRFFRAGWGETRDKLPRLLDDYVSRRWPAYLGPVREGTNIRHFLDYFAGGRPRKS